MMHTDAMEYKNQRVLFVPFGIQIYSAAPRAATSESEEVEKQWEGSNQSNKNMIQWRCGQRLVLISDIENKALQ